MSGHLTGFGKKRRHLSRDRLTRHLRSELMARIHQRDTEPELAVRRALHRLGLRFTVNGARNRDLIGRPDIVLPRWKTVIFVHGCFWHRHLGCRNTTTPTHRRKFWVAKFSANVARDKRCVAALKRAGWRVVIVWGCQTRDRNLLRRTLLRRFRTILGDGDAALRRRPRANFAPRTRTSEFARLAPRPSSSEQRPKE